MLERMTDYIKDAIAIEAVKIIIDSDCLIKQKELEDLSLEEVKRNIEFVLKIVEMNIEDEETIEWSLQVKEACNQWLSKYIKTINSCYYTYD